MWYLFFSASSDSLVQNRNIFPCLHVSISHLPTCSCSSYSCSYSSPSSCSYSSCSSFLLPQVWCARPASEQCQGLQWPDTVWRAHQSRHEGQHLPPVHLPPPFTYFGSLSYVWYKPASRATLAAPKPEAQPRAEGQVFTDPSKLCWQVHHSWLNLGEGFSWPALNNA